MRTAWIAAVVAVAAVVALVARAQSARACSIAVVDPLPDLARSLDGRSDVPPHLVLFVPSFTQTLLHVQRADGSERQDLFEGVLPGELNDPVMIVAELEPQTAYELRCDLDAATEVSCAKFTTAAATTRRRARPR